jgi:large exoprotein involved in heme utilization and adhesion
VTGGTASNIDGTLRSEITGANLYFLNPAGVMFGPNAQLDLTGSFTVSTADYVKFNAHPGGDDVLTSAPVIAFGFLSLAPAPFTASASDLAAASGKALSVIAGDVTFDGVRIAGSGSRLHVAGVRSVGETVATQSDPFSGIGVEAFGVLGTVELKNGTVVETSGLAGGRVVLRGGRLEVADSAIISETIAGRRGEGAALEQVLFNLKGKIELQEGTE